ncbi:MAG: hypothetical protein ACRYFU_13860 [Janthinobacterium lividum]
MRLLEFLAAALLWQNAVLLNIGTAASPEHLRLQRELELHESVSGLTCSTLDATVLAHTASAAHDDLRLYQSVPGRAGQAETPFLLTESGPEPVPAAEAEVEHLSRMGESLRFDLRMPPRPYSEIQLRLRLRDFIGTVVVTADHATDAAKAHGSEADRPRDLLGTFGVFDLHAQQLGRWTILPMAETSSPLLHLTLALRTPEGKSIRGVPLAVVEGAAVPPSRERQTRYTSVAATTNILQQGMVTEADLQVPAHVPVERIRFTMRPEPQGSYLREVIVRARPESNRNAETENMDAGSIEHVSLASGDPRLNPINVTEDSVDATLGATLAGAAAVRVIVANHALKPLPIQQVTLEMRERKVCFLPVPGARYTLRYGDAALPAPVYDETPFMEAKGTPAEAHLGPERSNPQWRPREDARPYLDRHPEVFWLVVLVCGGMMGASALHYVQHRKGGVQG